MHFQGLVEGRFISRLNRFAGLVNIDGQETLVHVANSGRMRELLVEGNRVLLKPATGDHRKTAFDLALVDLGHTLASADARLPNSLVYEALEEKRLPQFAAYDDILKEVVYGESRLDLALKGPRNPDGNPLLGRGIWSVRPIRAGRGSKFARAMRWRS